MYQRVLKVAVIPAFPVNAMVHLVQVAFVMNFATSLMIAVLMLPKLDAYVGLPTMLLLYWIEL